MTAFSVTFKRVHDVSIYEAKDSNGVGRFWPICTCRWNDDRKSKPRTFGDETTAVRYARQAHLEQLPVSALDAGVLTLRREMYG